MFEMTEFGLRGVHVMCIFYLHHNPEGLTATQLCALCVEDKAAISRTLSELEKEGYIIPPESSKKYRAPLKLSAQGELVALRLDEIITQWVNIGGSGLSDEERETFYHVLGIIAENLHQKSAECEQKHDHRHDHKHEHKH